MIRDLPAAPATVRAQAPARATLDAHRDRTNFTKILIILKRNGGMRVYGG